ncbi:MAG: 4Fe-4S binding protein [Clostridia bacterium]|nr:4Fe-4S binding protein [Clostridia bacterium]
MRVIDISANGFPEPKSCAYRLCINCGYCVDVCVFGALNHRVRKRSSDSKAAMKRYEAMQKNKKR